MVKIPDDATMTSADVRRAYVKLYKAMRNYIWNVSTVEKLADLEVACYDRFIDYDAVDRALNALKSSTTRIANEDDEFAEAFSDFGTVLEKAREFEPQYAEITKVIEEEDDEDK